MAEQMPNPQTLEEARAEIKRLWDRAIQAEKIAEDALRKLKSRGPIPGVRVRSIDLSGS